MSLDVNNLNLSPLAEEILNNAHNIASILRHEFIMPEHFMIATANICCTYEYDEDLEISTKLENIANEICVLLQNNVPQLENDITPTLSRLMKNIFDESRNLIQNEENIPTPVAAIVITILNSSDCLCNYILSKHINDQEIGSILTYLIKLDNDKAFGLNIDNNEDTIPEPSDTIPLTSMKSQNTNWAQYVTSLDSLKDNLSKNIIGRKSEMNRLAQILCRHNKNNAIIVGESGVGKSALVRGFIVNINKYPKRIAQLSTYELNTTAILANAQFHGDLENHISNIMNGIKNNGGGIIIVDDIHTLAGGKGDSNSSRDITGALMKYLDEESLRFIGITTFEDITRHLDSHTRFLRRFNRIDIEEPSQQETIDILNGVKSNIEQYHDISFSDDVTERAVKLSKRFLSNKALPDSAIDILDEAGAYRELNPINGNTTQIIDKDLIDTIVAQLGNVKNKIIDDNDTSQLRNLSENMRKSIFGQDQAIKQVVDAVLTARAGLTDNHKPQSCLLFVGPTGVGKTEVARVLSEQLGVTLHKFDMSEYSEQYSVSKLIGSSPGYIGYEEGGRLTEAVRKNPHCVLLLDEIEKAHEKIFDTLLQVMDYASLTDSRGRKVDFSHTIIILTSNSGARYAKMAGVGFGSKVTTGDAMLSEVKKTFKPEFINRLSGIVVFNDMSKEMATLILDKKIAELNTRLSERNVSISLTPEAHNWLLNNGFSEKYGAREIERVITHYLKPLLVSEILFGKLAKNGSATVIVKDNYLSLNINC